MKLCDYFMVGGFLFGYIVLATLAVSLIMWALHKRESQLMTTVAGITLGAVVAIGFLTVVGGIMAWRFGVRSYRRRPNATLPRFLQYEPEAGAEQERVTVE